jgi:hypothetical protein
MLEFMRQMRAGRSATASDAVSQVTGRPARTFEAWAREFAAAFQ